MKPDRSWVRARAQFAATAVLAVVMSALLLFPQNAFAAPAASPAAGTARASGLTFAQMMHYVYEATNQVRYDAGLSTGYARDTRLDKVAMAWAQQQWQNGAMSHNPDYSTQIPGGWQRAGENVASGYTYTQVVPAWVASPSHYANLVRDYTSIGIGYYEADGRRYWVQTFAKYPGTTVPAKPAPAPAPADPAPASPSTAPSPSAPPATGYRLSRPRPPGRRSPCARRRSRALPPAGRGAPASRARPPRRAAADTTSWRRAGPSRSR
jgi:uncharacterized protein YkwD